MYWLDTTLDFLHKYRGEIQRSIISVLAGVILGKLADFYLGAMTVDQITIGLLVAVSIFLGSLAFAIKRNVTSKVAHVEKRLAEIIGRGMPTQYEERKQHFTIEKNRLIEYLVRTHLPSTVERMTANKPIDSKIAILVDSGTGLEPFFPRIKSLGLGVGTASNLVNRLELYTNSLSGSDAFCKEQATALSQDQLHLFGGTQMEKYRAVTGDVTLTAMDAVREEYQSRGWLIIGLITANWILVGPACDKLILCSSEQGHLDYKRHLAKICDELIVVTPLGKLLGLDTTDELNELLNLNAEGLPKYEGFPINYSNLRNKENTFLLTTCRALQGSILYYHSENLKNAFNGDRHQLYTLCQDPRKLELDHRLPIQEQKEIEMPHTYLRTHSLRVLHFS